MNSRWTLPAASLLMSAASSSLPACPPPARFAPGRVLAFRHVAVMDTVTAVVHGRAGSDCTTGALPATVQLVGVPPYSGEQFRFRTVADARGTFQFMHIPAATYRLSAACLGYGGLAGDTLRLGTGDATELEISLGCRLP